MQGPSRRSTDSPQIFIPEIKRRGQRPLYFSMSYTIDEFLKKVRFSNNLNLLRFVAAVLVIYSHDYVVTGVTRWRDPLSHITDAQINFGGFAVLIFFFASGFYAAKSVISSEGKGFLLKRAKRLYPLFIAVMLLTVFVLGPVVSTLPVGEYFSSAQTYSYLLFLVMVPRYRLPGVFESNPTYLVNGSLWTMILEAVLSVLIYTAYKLKLLEKKKLTIINIPVLISLLLVYVIKVPGLYAVRSYLSPVYLFFIGAEYYVFKDRIRLDKRVGLVMVAALIGSVFIKQFETALILFLPYLISLIAFDLTQAPRKISFVGDYSYALYLAAFPIQQTLTQYFPEMGFTMHFLFSVVVSTIVAVLLTKAEKGAKRDSP